MDIYPKDKPKNESWIPIVKIEPLRTPKAKEPPKEIIKNENVVPKAVFLASQIQQSVTDIIEKKTLLQSY